MVEFVFRFVAWLVLELICCFTGVFLITLWQSAVGGRPSKYDINDRLSALVGMVFWCLVIFSGAWTYKLLHG
jgi:hypothetical protein